MKTNFTRSLIILTAITILYASCKKSGMKSSEQPSETDYMALSGQIAANFMKSLSGQYGGNINSGDIKTPSSINFTHKGPILFSTANPLCGYTLDTTYSNNIKPGDSTQYVFGLFKFTYICDNTRPFGYIEKDSVVNSVTGSKVLNYFYSVSQNYIVKATDLTYKVVTMDGGINSVISTTTYGPSYMAYGQSTNDITQRTVSTYVLNGVRVDVSGSVPDITTGSATFVNVITNINMNHPTGIITGSQGTIQFLGNHQARIIIQGSTVTYLVDMLTGTVTTG